MASIQELVKQLGDEKQDVAYRAYKALEQTVNRASAPANDQERAAAAADLAAELNAMTKPEKDEKGKEKPPKLVHSTRVRNKVARLLAYIAGAKEVPALAQAIADSEVREMARFALQRNPSGEATQALIKALDEVGPTFRAGVVNALGKRQGADVLATLQKSTEDEDRQVRIAAVEALANFADAGNDAFIAKATKADCPACRKQAQQARVRLAETLRKAGDKSAAERIYKAIGAGDADEPQKKAAEIGLKATG